MIRRKTPRPQSVVSYKIYANSFAYSSTKKQKFDKSLLLLFQKEIVYTRAGDKKNLVSTAKLRMLRINSQDYKQRID